jgi:hypothetical protein
VLGAVYIDMFGDHPNSMALSQVQVGIAIGRAVHQIGGGGASQAPPLALRVANSIAF